MKLKTLIAGIVVVLLCGAVGGTRSLDLHENHIGGALPADEAQCTPCRSETELCGAGLAGMRQVPGADRQASEDAASLGGSPRR